MCLVFLGICWRDFSLAKCPDMITAVHVVVQKKEVVGLT